MDKKLYWKKNLKYLSILLSIWFIVGILFSFVFIEELNHFKIGGFPLGFWFAVQGSMFVFVILVFVYVYLMNKLDKEFKANNLDN
jgi:putative solute:sodium symporter small subunit